MAAGRISRTAFAAWLRAPRARRRLAREAALALVHARLATLWPTRTYARHLGRLAAGDTDDAAAEKPGLASLRDAVEIGRMVERVARSMPFPALCLQQAIAARRMLRRRGIAATLHLGVVRDPAERAKSASGAIAHAWVRCGGQAVTGGEDVSRYVIVGSFV